MARKRSNRKKYRRGVGSGRARGPVRFKSRERTKPTKGRPKTRLNARRTVKSAKARGRAIASRRGKRSPTKRETKLRSAQEARSLESAIREMNRGRSLTAAARASQVSIARLRSYLAQPRRVPVMTDGRLRVLTVGGYQPARLVGQHHEAVGEFVRTNNRSLLKSFEGRTVQAVSGRRYPLETRPNTLHRIAAMDSPSFHEIYEITSKS